MLVYYALSGLIQFKLLINIPINLFSLIIGIIKTGIGNQPSETLSHQSFVLILVIEQGGFLKHHLHKIINFDQSDTVKIVLNGKAFVAFMDDENYERYIGDFEYDYFGTEVEESPFLMAPPSAGRWHLVIEQTDIPADMEVHVQIVSDL